MAKDKPLSGCARVWPSAGLYVTFFFAGWWYFATFESKRIWKILFKIYDFFVSTRCSALGPVTYQQNFSSKTIHLSHRSQPKPEGSNRNPPSQDYVRNPAQKTANHETTPKQGPQAAHVFWKRLLSKYMSISKYIYIHVFFNVKI